MRYHIFLFSLIIGLSGGVNAGELTGTLYGVSLGKHLDSLEGKKQRQTGIVSIKGVKHQMYLLDTGVYKLDPPFDRLLVQVEMDTLKVKGVIAMAEISIEECKIQSSELKINIEAKSGISFKELKHQGDIFYSHEVNEVFMIIGCQNKLKTVFQYQIGSSS